MLTSYSVPIDVKDRDVFHITTEEYLLALTDLIEELVSIVHRRYPQRVLTHSLTGKTRGQLSDLGRFPKTASDQQVCEGTPRRLPNTEHEKRRVEEEE